MRKNYTPLVVDFLSFFELKQIYVVFSYKKLTLLKLWFQLQETFLTWLILAVIQVPIIVYENCNCQYFYKKCILKIAREQTINPPDRWTIIF